MMLTMMMLTMMLMMMIFKLRAAEYRWRLRKRFLDRKRQVNDVLLLSKGTFITIMCTASSLQRFSQLHIAICSSQLSACVLIVNAKIMLNLNIFLIFAICVQFEICFGSFLDLILWTRGAKKIVKFMVFYQTSHSWWWLRTWAPNPHEAFMMIMKSKEHLVDIHVKSSVLVPAE